MSDGSRNDYYRRYRMDKIKCELCHQYTDKTNIKRHKLGARCQSLRTMYSKEYQYLKLRSELKKIVDSDETMIYFRTWKHYINKVHDEFEKRAKPARIVYEKSLKLDTDVIFDNLYYEKTETVNFD